MNRLVQLRKSSLQVFVILCLAIVLSSNPPFTSTINAQGESYSYLPFISKCSAPVYPLLNAGFEQGFVAWTFSQELSSLAALDHGIAAHEGVLMASLLSYGTFGIPDGYVEQFLTIPDCSPYLSFWWASFVGCSIVSGDRCGGNLVVKINGAQITSLWTQGGGAKPWNKVVLDLSAYRGSNVTAQFSAYAYRDSIDVYLDDITFQEKP